MAVRLLALMVVHCLAVETRFSTEEQRRIPWYVVSLVIPLLCTPSWPWPKAKTAYNRLGLHCTQQERVMKSESVATRVSLFRTYTFVHIYMNVYITIHIYMCTDTHTHIHKHISHAPSYTLSLTHTCIYKYIHIYLCIINVYIHTHTYEYV